MPNATVGTGATQLYRQLHGGAHIFTDGEREQEQIIDVLGKISGEGGL